MDIYLLSIEEVRAHYQGVIGSLDSERLNKSYRYAHEEDQLRSLAGGYLLQKHIQVPLLFTEKGKPYTENGPCFSLSHSGNFALLAIATSTIGVDIEKLRPFPRGVRRCCLQEEYKTDEDCFKAWCLKESYLKCIGTGLKGKMREIIEKSGLQEIDGTQYSLGTTTYKDHVIAICLEGNVPIEIKIVEETIG